MCCKKSKLKLITDHHNIQETRLSKHLKYISNKYTLKVVFFTTVS